MLNDLYAYRNSYLAAIGQTNGVEQISAVGLVAAFEEEQAKKLEAANAAEAKKKVGLNFAGGEAATGAAAAPGSKVTS